MLKRIFISLLILTALSSEGLAGIPANLYGLYIGYDTVRGMLDADEIASSSLPEKPADRDFSYTAIPVWQENSLTGLSGMSAFSPSFSFASVFPSKAKHGSLSIAYICDDGFALNKIEYYKLSYIPFKRSSCVILHKSDSSPPCLL
ncbi:MAG TPA: hypothetical protein VF941_11010 [Clostridia bacterium]